MQRKYPQFYEWINASKNIVFFGGAGVSTESGIPDFRSVDGLYNQKYKYPPETILSRTFFYKHTEEFFTFYKDKILVEASPNTTHYALAKLEKAGKLKAVITQNIDGLHQDAGSENVLELHGSVLRNYCTKCHAFYTKEDILAGGDIPLCPTCSSLIKPDVVLYEEALDNSVVDRAVQALEKADVLIIGGTSLTVYPAAGLIDLYRGKKLVLINKSITSFDQRADMLIQEGLGTMFKAFL